MADLVWRKIPITPAELSLAAVLRCGQTFRWKNVNSVWSFSTNDRVVLLKQDDAHLHYASIMGNASTRDGGDVSGARSARHSPTDNKNSIDGAQSENSPPVENIKNESQDSTLAFIHDYFNLHVSLSELYAHWTAVETQARGKCTSFAQFPGIRILRQDPWETVVLFICLSNNNVKRISKMCDALCAEYGRFLARHDGIDYFSFPGPQVLSLPEVEGRLRELGFGYRAKYIASTAKMFADSKWPHISLERLESLRTRPFAEAHEFLLQLTGVGPKVADCICLMALDKHDVVPVDTHVLQIAVRDYKYRGPRTMNKKTYEAVRGHLADLFGEYAGWAQLVMFAADLADLNNGVNEVEGQRVRHTVEKLVEKKVEKKVKLKKAKEAPAKSETVTHVQKELVHIKEENTEVDVLEKKESLLEKSEVIVKEKKGIVEVKEETDTFQQESVKTNIHVLQEISLNESQVSVPTKRSNVDPETGKVKTEARGPVSRLKRVKVELA